MEFFLTGLINGLSLGGIYAMIALGYTMVYGIAKMLNFAHGYGYIIYIIFCHCLIRSLSFTENRTSPF